MTKFYLTTPLYYVNDRPHLGTAYATINADVLARYHRLFGDEVQFLTGTDEHGLKVQQAADKRAVPPQQHCDELSEVFKSAWKNLEIEYDIFFRTTASDHVKAVQKSLQELYDSGDIYSDTYEGWYSVSEEIFYTEKDLVNGKSPTGNEVVKVNEKNYFFKMSKYQKALIDHIEKNPKFIQPENRRNETLGFLKQELNDLCISRPKARLSWGIEIPFDKDYVTYVWFDALLNYANGVGFKQDGRDKEFQTWWNEAGANHLIGKDILITHTVYWTTMLLALGARLPKTIFATGWILNKDNEKMSKSRGSVMNPDEMSKLVGVEELRYFLTREFRLGQDGPVSHELIVSRINTDLANNIGNLLSRTTNLIDKFFSGLAPKVYGSENLTSIQTSDASTQALVALALGTPQKVEKLIQDFSPNEAIEQVMLLLTETNRYLEEKAPWKIAKTDVLAAGQSLYVALEVLRIAASLLLPVMPNKMSTLLKTIGVTTIGALNIDALKIVGELNAISPAQWLSFWQTLNQWGAIKEGTPVAKSTPLFPRIELAAE